MLTYLDAPNQEPNMVMQFGGYNHRLSIAENEFFDMKNMSGKDFPLASTRKKRGVIENDNLSTAQTLTAKDNLLFAYTGYGDIGVELVNGVPENVWQDPSNTGKTETEVIYTTICPYISNDLTEAILTSKKNVSNFGRYTITGSSLASASGKTPIIDGNELKVEWEHEKIPKNTLWAKSLFKVEHWYSLYSKKVSVKSNSFLDNENNRKALIGKDLWFSGNTVKVVSIEKSGGFTFFRDDWTIEFEDKATNAYEGKSVYVFLTEPLAQDIPEGKYVVDEEDVKINTPTEVEVKSVSASHIKVLKGQTITFVDSKGEHDCKVADYSIKDGVNKLILECPHDAIESGATAYGDRLFLCEFNPHSGETTTTNIFSAAEGKHTVLEMGANVVIFPEKVVVNTQKKEAGQFTEIETLEKTQVVSGEAVYFQLVDGSGNDFVDDKGKALLEVGNTAPLDPDNGFGWIDTSTDPPTFKVYSEQIEQWAKTPTYCRVYLGGTVDWEVGDAVELEFSEGGILGDKIAPIEGQKYFVISKVQDGFIYFPVAMKAAQFSLTGTLTIKRTIPDMDFVIENENRLWGCKYGEVDGEPINEIFACKLGDPKNWHYFANTSMDSYYVNLGADGEFTGAISYAGNPFFFREGCIHRIYGNYPSNYALKTIYCHGVEEGSHKGITVMNDVMYYKSPVGIMAYTGATPVNVTENFGGVRYKNAVAGSVGSKMYFSMQDESGNNVLFTFDDNTKLWHKEDDLRCKDMVTYDNEVYALADNGTILAMDGGSGVTEGDFTWYLESGNIGYYTPFYKHLSRLNLKLQLDMGARASLSIQYDSDGNWYHITELNATGKVKGVTVPVSPQRCDHFALKIEGKGGCKILSITKYVEGGSDDE